jgi:uncharacterized protein YcgI (DUF1989 family)
MGSQKRIEVPPMSACAFRVGAGSLLTIIDTAGKQPGDLVAFAEHDLGCTFSQARTRVENGRCRLTAGDRLWTNTFPPQVMLSIERDTYGRHDLLYTPCCRYALEKRFGVQRDGCLENLASALRPWEIAPRDVPDPLNLFFPVEVDDNGRMRVGKPDSPTGATVALRAEMDCIVAVSTCAAPIPDAPNTGYLIEIEGC